jgi:two-component system chemotaxis response regulator CheY
VKVLIVDDSSTVRDEVRVALMAGGHDVLEARDGVEGLEEIERSPDLGVVILDVNMPRMNGIELLSRLQDDSREVPVLMLTTEGQPNLIRRAKAAGAKAWMVKPFKADQLLKAVAKLGGGS